MLMRWDPFRDLDRLTEQLWSSTTGPKAVSRSFPMDAYRRGETFFVHFDLPGVDPDGIDLSVEKNVLTISVERSWQPDEGDEVLAVERPRGRFTRQLFLGETLDTDRLQARYDQGVLTLSIPVAEAAKPRRVEVSVGAGTARPQAIEAEHTAAGESSAA
jgi:HSP20 family protein